MSELPRKNCWSIAEHAGDPSPGRMQHLLERAEWDTMAAMAAMAAVRGLVCERLDDGDAVAILDESGQEEKGDRHSRRAGVPEEMVFATKPELGRQILADLARRRTPAEMGDRRRCLRRDPGLRAWLESPQVNTGYVLAIAASTRIALNSATTVRADTLLKTLIASDWVIASCGQGSKGERRYSWTWAATADPLGLQSAAQARVLAKRLVAGAPPNGSRPAARRAWERCSTASARAGRAVTPMGPRLPRSSCGIRRRLSWPAPSPNDCDASNCT